MSETSEADRVSSGTVLQHILVFAARSIIAIRADQALEIWETERFHPVPRTPEYVIGITNWRGTPLPLVDLAAALQLSDSSRADSRSTLGSRRVVVVSVEHLLVGLVVDGTAGVLDVHDADCREPTVNTSGRLAEFSIGEVDAPRGIASIVDMGSLLEGLRVRA